MTRNITIFDKLASIGCQFSDVQLVSVDIEATLAEAIETLPFSKDRGRILKVLCSWIIENGNQVILEKLAKILTQKAAAGADVSYAALLGAFAVSRKLHKWHILKKFRPDVTLEALEKKGTALEEWAQDVHFAISKGAIQTDAKYTLSRAQIAKLHKQYRNRLIYGAQYRADIVTATQLGITAIKDIVNLIGVSREPASRILAELRDAGIIQDEQAAKASRSYLEASPASRRKG
jgi:hypothetical protein